MIENQFGAHVKQIRSDNGPEFSLAEFYSSKGILHQTSCVATPQQNGRVERKHQHILNVARALLFQSNLPKKLWCYAIQHAVYIINRVPSRLIQHKSPYELLHGEQPTFNDLRTFGSLCFASTNHEHRSKFDHRSKGCVFIGFKPGVKGYLILDLQSQQISISKDV